MILFLLIVHYIQRCSSNLTLIQSDFSGIQILEVNFYSLREAILFFDDAPAFNYELILDHHAELVDQFTFDKKSKLVFTCGLTDIKCKIKFNGKAHILIANSNFSIYNCEFTLDGSNLKVFDAINSLLVLNNCSFASIIINVPVTNIFALIDSTLILIVVELSYISIQAGETLIRGSNSHILINGFRTANIKFENGTRLITVEDSFISARNVSLQDNNPSSNLLNDINSMESGLIHALNSYFYFQGLLLRDINFFNFHVLEASRSKFINISILQDVSLVNIVSNKSILFKIRDFSTGFSAQNLSIDNCSFFDEFVFDIRNMTGVLILSKVTAKQSFLSSFFALVAVYHTKLYDFLAIGCSFYKGDSGKASDTIVTINKFFIAEIFNITINDYFKTKPALIFNNMQEATKNVLVSIYKCSFFNTVTVYREPSRLNQPENGGIFCFLNINEVYIESCIFKNNSIANGITVTGGVGIYFYTQNLKDILKITDSSFISSRVTEGPILINFRGSQFGLFNCFISNQFISGPSIQGLNVIKIVGSIIKIDRLLVCDTRFTDGMIAVIELNTMNRLEVQNVIIINNTASKRGGGSFLLDGNSKDREILVKDSIFINNAANTQNAAGFHLFHTTLFWRLNITYEGNRHFHNIASLGTDWWVRVARKNAFILIINCEFQSSYTFSRPTDFGFFYLGGWEPGSFLTAKDCLFNRSISKAYGFYIKDIYVTLENVSLSNQSATKPYSSLIYVEGGGMHLSRCTINNKSFNFNFFNIRDRASLSIIDSKFIDIALDSFLIRIVKTKLLITNTLFISIKSESLLYIISSGKDVPIRIEECIFVNLSTKIAQLDDSYLSINKSLFNRVNSNIILMLSSYIDLLSIVVSNITLLGLPGASLIKATESFINFNSISISHITGSVGADILFFRFCEISIIEAAIFKVDAQEEKGLITALYSKMIIKRAAFLTIKWFVIKVSRVSLDISYSLFTNSIVQTKGARKINFFILFMEGQSSELSFSIFTRSVSKSTPIIGNLMATPQAILNIHDNVLEELTSLTTNGGSLYFEDTNFLLRSNIFSKNKAVEAGALYVFCDALKVPGNEYKCLWSLINNIFNANSAEKSAGALLWKYIPPIAESENIYSRNSAGNGLEFQSFPIRLIPSVNFKENIKINENLFQIFNQKSGNFLDTFELFVIDTYNQIIDGVSQLTIDVIPDEFNFACSEFILGECPFDKLIKANLELNKAYLNKESPYEISKPSAFGKTLVLKNQTERKSNSYKFDATYIRGTPSYTVFLNITSEDFKFNNRNIEKSAVFQSFIFGKKIYLANEIITQTSYSFIIPVHLDFCREGEFYDYDRGYCENCRIEFYNYKVNQTECIPCPIGLLCFGGNQVKVRPGYWRKNNLTEKIYECSKKESSCLGGEDDKCGQNYEGNLCFECSSNSNIPMEKTYTNECRACPPTGSLVFVSISFWIVLLLVCWTLSKAFMAKDQNPRKKIVIKCLINYLHSFLLLNDYNLDASTVFQSYLKWLNGLSQGVRYWFAMDCLALIITSNKKVYIKYIFEIVAFHLFLTLFLFLRFRVTRNVFGEIRRMRRLDEILFIWYLFYPSVFDYLIRNIMCINIDGVLYAMNSPNEECFSFENKIFIAASVIIIIAWSVLIPLVALKFRIKRRVFLKKKSSGGIFKQYMKKTTINDDTAHAKVESKKLNEDTFILNTHYKRNSFQIEFFSYLFKLLIYSINALAVEGSIKVLALWPFLMYGQFLEFRLWKFFVFQLQKTLSLFINLNYMLLSYACLWLTVEKKIYSDIFFFFSFVFQIAVIGIMSWAYFEHFIRNKFVSLRRKLIGRVKSRPE